MRSRIRPFNRPRAIDILGLPTLIALALLLLVAPCKSVYAFDLPQYYEQNNNKSFHNKAEFLQGFPYDAYLKTVNLTDFSALQRDRFFIYTKFGDGDEFLYNLGERFLSLYPLRNVPGDLNQKIQIGEAFLNPRKGFRREVNEIYIVIGYFILSKVAQKIGQEIAAKKYDESESERAAIIQRLAHDRVYISREESTAGKIMRHLWDPRYLWERFHSVILTHQKKTKYLVTALVVTSIALILFGRRPKLRLLKVLGVFGILAALLPAIALLTEPRAASASSKQPSATTSLKLAPNRYLHPINNGSDHAVKIYKILGSNGEIGQAIWLDRDAVKSSYLAFEKVPDKYRTYEAANRVVLATSGGYTNLDRQPEGFTTEDGNVVNPVLMPDRHGLAMVSDGGINVLNIKDDAFQLPHGPRIKNPQDSLLAYGQLLQWCRTNHATLFQTHLLAFRDKVLINAQKADPKVRERRILALARDKKTQRLYHVIFNITLQYNLAEIATEIFGLLQQGNFKIEAMLNLDVGSYNIMFVYDENRNLLQDVKGTVDISQATNLLVYTR